MKRYVPLVMGILAAMLFVRLGIWQLDRLAQRKARNAEVERKMAQPEVEAGEVGEARDLAFRRARAHGRFDFDHQIIEMLRTQDELPGVYVVTPLIVDSAHAVLVERGWYPSPDARRVRLEDLAEPDSTEVEGLLLRPVAADSVAPDTPWPVYVREAGPEALQQAYGYRLFPLVLRRTALPPGAPAGLKPLRGPELTNGPHLSYAIQWFAFALIAVVGSGILVAKPVRR